jgi:L-threonylcarbamoyladenylate synthase
MEIIGLNLKKAVEAIKEGKIIVCPTDTVYGLICDAADKKAIERLYQIKKRPRNKPIPIFVRDIKMAKKLVKINPNQEKFLKKVWPGPVTAILPAKKKKGTLGIRVPNHKFVLNLFKHLGRPLAETSANISGQPASTKIKEVLKQFEGKSIQPDLVIDAGNLKKSRPSIVIDLTIWPPKILRF